MVSGMRLLGDTCGVCASDVISTGEGEEPGSRAEGEDNGQIEEEGGV